MQREILIHSREGKRTGALVEDGVLCEYWLDHNAELAGRMVKGRVERYVPGMKCTFVSIGMERNGFLPMHEQLQEKPLPTGKEILVQVKKAPQGTKGAYLSQQISIPGEYLIFLPLQHKLGVSNKIESEDERDRLLHLAANLCGEEAGMILRTNAAEASDDAVAAEFETLKEKWRAIHEESLGHGAPYWLPSDELNTDRLLMDYSGRIQRLVTNDPQVCESYKEKVECQLYQGETDLFDLYNIPKQVDTALWPKVWLKSGGYLVIDACEAMTVIDVNTGKYTGGRLLEDTLFKLNLEACRTIAQQVRLRNLSGIILIDFIDMKEECHRIQVQEALKEAFQEDRQKTVLHGFTSLELFEMTRKRNAPPIGQWLTKPCPHCQGIGRLEGGFLPHE